MTRGRRARRVRTRSRKGLLVVLGLVALVVALLGWSLNTILSATLEDDDSPTATDRNDTGTLVDSEPGQSGPDDVQALLDECAAAVTKAEQAITAADPGVTGWATHVKARTDMLKGRISVKRMDAIYGRTRSQGHVNQDRFQAALAELDGGQSCEELRSSGADARTASVQDCLERSRAAATALTAARRAMTEWEHHLHHMDQFEDGGMSTGAALRLWVEAWRKAPVNISAYRDARTALEAAPPCAAP